MLLNIPPLKEADLPKREKPLWKMMGPGIVMAGIAIGSGELVMWPWITSIVGADLLWAAAIGIFLQLWINIEVGRWAVVTGESPFNGMARFFKLSVYIFLFVVFANNFLPGWARETGMALKALLYGPDHDSPQWMWTAIVFAAIAATLFGPKVVYTAVERSIMFLVLIIVVGLMYIVWKIGTKEVFVAMWEGLLNVGHFPKFPVEIPATESSAASFFTFGQLFGAVVFAGLGGISNLWYAYYLREKRVGMGGRMPTLMSAVHKHEVKEMDIGYVYPETEENQSRFKDWMRYVVIDQVFFFWILGSFTMFLFIFGSLAVLHPQGQVPDKGSLVWDLANILGDSMGDFGRNLFLIVGMAALFSSQLGGVDGTSRIFADLLHTNFRFGHRLRLDQWYFVLALSAILIGTASVFVFEKYDIAGLDFLFIAALMGGFVMAIYVPVLLYMNLTYLPKSARPGWVNIFFMVMASLMYISFSVYTIYIKVVSLFTG